MNIDRVSLTQDEAKWFSRYVLKMIVFMENAGKKDKEILNRTTYRVLVSMQDKAAFIHSTPEVPLNDLNLNRKQKLLMRDLIGGVTKNLQNVIIPEYKKRSDEKRLLASENQVMFLETLSRKFRV